MSIALILRKAVSCGWSSMGWSFHNEFSFLIPISLRVIAKDAMYRPANGGGGRHLSCSVRALSDLKCSLDKDRKIN